MNTEDQINQLKSIINENNFKYYVLDEPTISDSEYDTLLRSLEALENNNKELITPDSPTQRVGAKPSSRFGTIEHSVPMLSLANAMNSNALELFDERVKKILSKKKISYVAEPKLDGLGVEVVYEKGFLKNASTRGDGFRGEDITQIITIIYSL